jgi:hypothetical protein
VVGAPSNLLLGCVLLSIPNVSYDDLLQNVRPTPREGHACASWGDNSLILFGGWGGGIRNDIYILKRSSQVGVSYTAFAVTAPAAGHNTCSNLCRPQVVAIAVVTGSATVDCANHQWHQA